MLQKTGVDLPGEAGTIIHKKENVGEVELNTIKFTKTIIGNPNGVIVKRRLGECDVGCVRFVVG